MDIERAGDAKQIHALDLDGRHTIELVRRDERKDRWRYHVIMRQLPLWRYCVPPMRAGDQNKNELVEPVGLTDWGPAHGGCLGEGTMPLL